MNRIDGGKNKHNKEEVYGLLIFLLLLWVLEKEIERDKSISFNTLHGSFCPLLFSLDFSLFGQRISNMLYIYIILLSSSLLFARRLWYSYTSNSPKYHISIQTRAQLRFEISLTKSTIIIDISIIILYKIDNDYCYF